MKKRGIISVLLLLSVMFVLSVPLQASAATYKWVTTSSGKRCYKNGKLVKNAWVGDKHLNTSGYMDIDKWVYKKVDGVKKKVFVRHDGKYVPNFKGGMQLIGKKRYFYRTNGKLYKKKLITVKSSSGTKKYYVNAYGYCATGLTKLSTGYYYFNKNTGAMISGCWKTINGKKYCFQKKTGKAYTGGIKTISNGKKYYFTAKGVMQTGWKKVNGKYYYFKNYMRKGWVTIGSKKYYLSTSSGARVSGVYGIGGKLYCFSSSDGHLMTNVKVSYKGRKYVVDSQGVCSLIPDTKAPSADMLFFLRFESGSAAYNQTGGDNGNACGAYQFDNRYSLLPFVKYAYSSNAKLCKEFKVYAAYTNGTKLKSNKKFYTAWHTIYNRNPQLFAELQDKFAKSNYYDPVEQSLAKSGINLGKRSDVVKGAVYSYSIQHGQTTAINAVKALKVTEATSDANFIKKLYAYRIKKWPAYKTRYTQERDLALSIL